MLGLNWRMRALVLSLMKLCCRSLMCIGVTRLNFCNHLRQLHRGSMQIRTVKPGTVVLVTGRVASASCKCLCGRFRGFDFGHSLIWRIDWSWFAPVVSWKNSLRTSFEHGRAWIRQSHFVFRANTGNHFYIAWTNGRARHEENGPVLTIDWTLLSVCVTLVPVTTLLMVNPSWNTSSDGRGSVGVCASSS